MGDANATQTTGQDTGNSALNSFDPNAYGSAWQSGNTGLFNSQVGSGANNATDFMNSYKKTLSGLYDTANSMYNVPALQNNATTLNNAVLNTPQDTLNSAKGFNYDQNQVNNQTNLTLGRLSPLATAATNSAQTAAQLRDSYVNTNIAPTTTYGQQLSDAMARASTNFTTANEQTLNALIAKQQSGVQLSQSELQLAGQLASAKASYDATVQAAQLKNQYQTLSPTQTLANTFTGGTQRFT